MRLITLLSGYALGIAIAMKYRKKSDEITQTHPEKSKLDAFLDEVIDIHKSAYTEIKGFFSERFDNIENISDLQSRVSSFLDSLKEESQSFLCHLRKTSGEKKSRIEKAIDIFFDEKELLLEKARRKAEELKNATTGLTTNWIDSAKSRFEDIRKDVKENIHSYENTRKSPVRRSQKKNPSKTTV